MTSIWSSLGSALGLIFSLDRDVVHICAVSIRVSLVSTVLASLAGLPLGIIIGTSTFRGKRMLTALINTLFALPTVGVGVFVYCLISRSGPFGSWELLFTPAAIVIGQFVLAMPIVTALTIASVEGVDKRLEPTAKTLGASAWQAKAAVLYESRHAAAAAVAAGFGRVFGEVGVSMILGGGIAGYTRTVPAAIVMETGKGNFELALALGMVLLVIALVINVVIQRLKGASKP
jgi:tungstate transport system permease protein